MEKFIIVSQTCDNCYKVLEDIHKNYLSSVLDKFGITLVFYNDYFSQKAFIMNAVVNRLKEIDPDRFDGTNEVYPIFVTLEDKKVEIVAIGANSIVESLKDLAKIKI